MEVAASFLQGFLQIFTWPTLGLGSRTAHDEAPRRTPAQIDVIDLSRIAGSAAAEGIGL